MKLLLLSFTIFTSGAFASGFHCQIILSSKASYPDNLVIPDIKNKKECIEEAKILFEKNKNTYDELHLILKDKIEKVEIDEE